MTQTRQVGYMDKLYDVVEEILGMFNIPNSAIGPLGSRGNKGIEVNLTGEDLDRRPKEMGIIARTLWDIAKEDHLAYEAVPQGRGYSLQLRIENRKRRN